MKEQQLKDLMTDIILEKYAKTVLKKVKKHGTDSLHPLEKAKYNAAVELSSSEELPKRSLYDQAREKYQKPFVDELRTKILDASNRLYRLGQESNFNLDLRQSKLAKTLSFIEKLDPVKLNVLKANPHKYKEFCMQAHMDMELPNKNGRLRHLQTYLDIVLDLEDAPTNNSAKNDSNNTKLIAISTPIITKYSHKNDPTNVERICQVLEKPMLLKNPIQRNDSLIIDHNTVQTKSKLRASTMFKGLLGKISHATEAIFVQTRDLLSKSINASLLALGLMALTAPYIHSNDTIDNETIEITASFNNASNVAPVTFTNVPELMPVSDINNINYTTQSYDFEPITTNIVPESLPNDPFVDMVPDITHDTIEPELMTTAPSFMEYSYNDKNIDVQKPLQTETSNHFANVSAPSLTVPSMDIDALPVINAQETLSMFNVADAIKDFYAYQNVEFTPNMDADLNRIQYGLDNNITGHAEMRVQEWGVQILNDFGSEIASDFAWELNKLIERQDGSFAAKSIVANDLDRWSTVQGHYKFKLGV